jgi:hypothetical protein
MWSTVSKKKRQIHGKRKGLVTAVYQNTKHKFKLRYYCLNCLLKFKLDVSNVHKAKRSLCIVE